MSVGNPAYSGGEGGDQKSGQGSGERAGKADASVGADIHSPQVGDQISAPGKRLATFRGGGIGGGFGQRCGRGDVQNGDENAS